MHSSSRILPRVFSCILPRVFSCILPRAFSLVHSFSRSLVHSYAPSRILPRAMQRFRNAANEALACIWDDEVAAQAAGFPKEFDRLLVQLQYSAAARKLAGNALHKPLTSAQIQGATAFAEFILAEKEEKEVLEQKRLRLRGLGYKPLSILAVLCSASHLIKVAQPTFEAFLSGAGKIAGWSSWPNNPELINALSVVNPSFAVMAVQPSPDPVPTVTPTRSQPAPPRAAVQPSSPSPATGAPDTACTALPTRPQPASQWVLTCSFCATVVRPRCACEHTTGKRPDSSSSLS